MAPHDIGGAARSAHEAGRDAGAVPRGMAVSSLKLAQRDRLECQGVRGLLGRKLAFKARPRGRKAGIVAAIENNPRASDCVLAERFGVTRQRVQQIRAECGLQRSGLSGGRVSRGVG